MIECAELNEVGLIERARTAVYEEAWIVGECAHVWTERFARGRTDADLAELIELTRQQVQVRRSVFGRFMDSPHRDQLRWSHFAKAVAWEDADDVLAWAAEQDATVAEMTAYRRALRGEDLLKAEAGELDAPADDVESVPVASAPRATSKKKRAAKVPHDTLRSQPPGVTVIAPARSVALSKSEPNEPESDEIPASAIETNTCQADTCDPDRLAQQIENLLQNCPVECQVKAVQSLLSRMLNRVEGIHEVLPPLNQETHDVTEVVRDVVAWTEAQVKSVTDGDPELYREIASTLQQACVSVNELTKKATVGQLALFDAGEGFRGRVGINELLEVWNETWETEASPTVSRRAHLRARCRDPFFVDNWKRAIEHARSQKFCSGHNDRGWIANIDWFLRPNTVHRILEGNYDDTTPQSAAASPAEKRETSNAQAIFTALGFTRQ